MPQQFMDRAKQVGGTVVAADYCSTWSHVAWQEAGCSALGVTLPAVRQLEKDPRHGLAVVVAGSPKGLKNLYELVSLAHDQMYYRPRVKWEQLEHVPGCVALIDDVLQDDVEHAWKHVPRYLLKPRSFVYNGRGFGIPAMDVRYPRIEDREKYNLVSQMAHSIGDLEGQPTHMVRPSEWGRMMVPYGILGQDANAIWYEFNAKLPKASLLQVNGDLENEIRQSPRYRSHEHDEAYQARLRRELSLIREKGFESYFLFVADLVKWAKQHMLVGPGRGSAGGSLVCYVLGITEVDPMVYGTLFERFIDPGRSDLPDIDVDFADIHRDKIFDYLRGRYGEGKVVRLGTLSEFGGKSAINDVGRVYKTPFNVCRSVTGVLDDFSQAQQYLATVDFALTHKSNADTLEAFPELEKARWIDGLPRHTGVHAAGVIVSQEPISLFGASKDGVICMDMRAAEKLGLMKMDALGLKTLSVITDTMKMVGRDPYEIYDLVMEDPKVWSIFNEDRVTGVFQFEGHAVRGLMRQINVGKFEDLCALTSLARPGPLSSGAAQSWCDRKNGASNWQSPISTLDKTYGLIVYQEQAMQVVRQLAGFDEYEVNGFRKAIGKKDPVKLASYREQFIQGGAASNVSISELEELWHAMERFGEYAFNYSHAVAYSMLSYYTAWLKAHYPNEYAVCYLKNTSDEDSQRAILREIGNKNVVFFDPERSEKDWCIKDGVLIGGFTNVKGIGPKMAEQILAKRQLDPDGWMESLTDSQRSKLNNGTPFDDLHFFSDHYHGVYTQPEHYRIRNKVWKIEDIPAERGDYTFLGRLTKIIEREKDDGKGNKYTYALAFFSDDTDEMPCTINRYKWGDFKAGPDGKPTLKVGVPYIIRGEIINDGRKWLFIDKARQLHEPVQATTDQTQPIPCGETQGSECEGAGT